tara:strand:+ start:1541 stop:2185 length:645 start_codon:yes stop_codon:yes gene_type:complete
MAIVEKTVVDWEVIMLDTSVLVALFHSENPKTVDDDVLFTRELIDYLNSSNSGENKPRKFIISSISISEILVKENDQEKIKRILRVLNSDNVEFVDFDFETGLLFNKELYVHLSKEKLHEYAKEFGFKTNDYMMAREWITRDFMIIMSGVSNKADVILTADKKTFYPLAIKANAFCGLTYRKYFEKPHRSVTKYYHNEVLKDNKPVLPQYIHTK